MSIATAYFNYQTANINTDPHYNKGEAPAITSLRQYVLKQYGGVSLGSFGVRPVRGGTAPSTHAFGAAWDWRYVNADGTGLVGRTAMLNTVMPFLINHSAELGIQMIGDYIGCRIWKADRSGDVNHGWKPQSPNAEGMGQAWAGWLHIEIHPSEWSDGRDVATKIGTTGMPPFNPAAGQFSLWPLAAKPAIRLGSAGDVVRYLQGVLRKDGFGVVIDGSFGNQTTQVVRTFQTKHGLTADGVVGPVTWKTVDAIALR